MPAKNDTKYSGESFTEKANEYFEITDRTKIIKYDVVKTGERAGQQLEIPINTPYTVVGLCEHLDITEQTFINYCSEHQENKGLFESATRANRKIKANQIAGGLAGVLNSSMVASLNNMVQKHQVDNTTIDATGKTEDEIRAAINAIKAARNKK